MKELKYLNRFFWKYKYHFLFGIVFTIAAQIFSLFTPKLISNSIDAIGSSLESGNSIETVKNEIGLNFFYIIATTLISGFLTFLMRQTLIVMSRHIEFDLKNEVYAQYQRLSQAFFKNIRIGDLMNRISEDVGKTRMYVGPALMYSINTSIRFFVVIAYMFNVSPKLTLYTLLPLPILAVVIYKLSRAINRKSVNFMQNLSQLSSMSQEVFSGIRIIKSNALEGIQNRKVRELAEESKNKNNDLSFSQAIFGPLMIALIGISNLIVIYVGGVMYIENHPDIASLGVIAEFILYVNMLTWPVASIGWVSNMVQEAEASQGRINEFLKTEPAIQDGESEVQMSKGKIEFKNVSFTYPDTGIKALENINLTIEAGQTVAIIGPTGSGKSTLLHLACRLYDPEQGEICIDGVSLKDWKLSHLRDPMGLVPQEAFLFSDSIGNNIRFGKNDATKEQIIAAAKGAAVHESIMQFPAAYETILGERGITLSGGQKQRVSLARALIKDPKILLLDDSLSAVDTETEEKILRFLSQFTKNRTTLIVTHRVSAAQTADFIIALNDGKVAEIGTHNQLITNKKYYYELYNKQLSERK